MNYLKLVNTHLFSNVSIGINIFPSKKKGISIFLLKKRYYFFVVENLLEINLAYIYIFNLSFLFDLDMLVNTHLFSNESIVD